MSAPPSTETPQESTYSGSEPVEVTLFTIYNVFLAVIVYGDYISQVTGGQRIPL
ncbi:hypothetical protein AG1IA_00806 [Rhizoctonia solani AG-1 IA]|uniref:Uncharacterized protein n=1 Tax=Thanatephorus cucumeris (strain AG1-IA) TaxID=983506 RepID=L8X4M8_THACA|nr:hypothetical protein AG1IA_00806 [Rhizoctonia solani AG-1 IA]